MTRRITTIALMTAVIAVCSWISIPTTIPFTLQLMGVFLTLKVLGAKDGLISICIYILMGVIGLPVFASFNSGVGTLLGPTGGFIVGFIAIGITYIVFPKFQDVIGLILCYSCGILWFCYVSMGTIDAEGIISSLTICVVPFVIPDIIKIVVANIITKRIKPVIDNG